MQKAARSTIYNLLQKKTHLVQKHAQVDIYTHICIYAHFRRGSRRGRLPRAIQKGVQTLTMEYSKTQLRVLA